MYDNEEIVDILDVSLSSVKNWRRKLRANKDNSICLIRKKGSGRHAKLTDKQKLQLKDIILAGAVKAGYPTERWTSIIIADVILRTFGIKMAPRSVRDMLPTLGLSPQMPVVKSHKHSDEAVEEWSKHKWKALKKKRRNSASH